MKIAKKNIGILGDINLHSTSMGANLAKEIEKLREKQVNELTLKDKGIEELPPNIGSLETLIQLNLSNNKLKSLPPQIGNLHNVTHFNLHNNKLRELPQEITKLSDLEELNVAVNKVVLLCR